MSILSASVLNYFVVSLELSKWREIYE